MQPSQEGIKKEIIKHSFKDIEVIYEAGKTKLTAQDKSLLAAFTKLHDFEQELKDTAQALFQEAIPISKNIEELREKLKEVQASLDTCTALADKLSEANYVFEETSLEKLEEARQQTEEKLKGFNKKILGIYEETKILQEKVTHYHEADENGTEGLYDKCSTLAMAHIKNWENNAMDSVAFDDHFDKFREYREMVERRRENLINTCTETITNYTTLNLQTSTLYNVWNEFIKRCVLLQAVSDLHNRATGFTSN